MNPKLVAVKAIANITNTHNSQPEDAFSFEAWCEDMEMKVALREEVQLAEQRLVTAENNGIYDAFSAAMVEFTEEMISDINRKWEGNDPR